MVSRNFRLDAPPSRDPGPEDEGEGRQKVHGKNSARGEEKFALIRAIPRTGRTHQIRVHLSAIGHRIVGDKIYGPDEQLYLRFIDGDGRLNWSNGYCCLVMHFTRRNWRLKVSGNGPVRCLLILLSSVAAMDDRRRPRSGGL